MRKRRSSRPKPIAISVTFQPIRRAASACPIFTPIERVNFVVEHTRVGQAVDFDRLIFEILTNGSIDPEDALTQAASILQGHAKVIAEFNQIETPESPVSELPEEVQNTALADLGPAERELVESITRRIVAKLLHEPSVRLRNQAGTPQGARNAAAVHDLFDL